MTVLPYCRAIGCFTRAVVVWEAGDNRKWADPPFRAAGACANPDHLTRTRKWIAVAGTPVIVAGAYPRTSPPPEQKAQPMTADRISTPIPRDRWSRPLIVPPEGGKAIPYTRVTTLAGTIESTFNLSRWQQRMVALGLSERPDLLLAVAAHRDDKDKLNRICEDALEAAKAHAAATTGTALHALCEQIDRGQTVGVVPDAYIADLAAYTSATEGMTHHHIEEMVVVDSLKVAGTPDRITSHPSWQGKRIVDLKTGSIEYGMAKIEMQLAMYAHGLLYDHRDQSRQPLPDIDLDTATVLHLPAGSGTCKPVDIDIAVGWEGVQLATSVRAWRARKHVGRPHGGTSAGFDAAYLAARVRTAETLDDLTHLWIEGDTAGTWTAELTDLARARKGELTQAVAV